MVRDLLISLVPNQVSVFNFKTHPSTYHSTSGSLFWAIRSFNYGLLWYLLYFGLIRMNILMLDTRNVEQTKDVRMYT